MRRKEMFTLFFLMGLISPAWAQQEAPPKQESSPAWNQGQIPGAQLAIGTEEQTGTPPSNPVSPSVGNETSLHLIAGVPFVRWGDAARMNYQGKSVTNPSYAAASAMILEYWGKNRKKMEGKQDPMKDWKNESSGMGNLEDIKRLIDRKIPVLVSPAFTPHAHRQYLTLAGWMASEKAGAKKTNAGHEVSFEQLLQMVHTSYAFETEGPASGAFGAWLPLEKYQELQKQGAPVLNESVVIASRVVIGYDDARRVVILHDPTFGPAWEVGYDDFWKMWNFLGTPKYSASYPPDYLQILAKKKPATPYLRSADNEAAVHYVYGYAWQAIGQPAAAEKEYRQGIELSGIGPAYRDLLNMELAVTLAALGRSAEALPYARRATELIPEHSRAWHVLANILSTGGADTAEAKKQAAEAEERARTLCTDKYERTIAAALAQDFSLLSCKGHGYLQWGLR